MAAADPVAADLLAPVRELVMNLEERAIGQRSRAERAEATVKSLEGENRRLVSELADARVVLRKMATEETALREAVKARDEVVSELTAALATVNTECDALTRRNHDLSEENYRLATKLEEGRAA